MFRQSIIYTLNFGAKPLRPPSGVPIQDSLPSLRNNWSIARAQLSSATNKSHHTLISTYPSEHQKSFNTSRGASKQIVRGIVRGKRLISKKRTELPEKFKMEWPKITLFGDSITRRAHHPDEGCWGSYLAARVGSYFHVDPFGFEGYNTKWALELAPQLFPKSYLDKVELFIIFFGANDSWEATSPLHVPVEQYEANLQGIVKYLVDNGLEKRKILLITPGWYHDPDFQEFLRREGTPSTRKDLDSARSYRDAVVRLANWEGVDYLDFFEASLHYEPFSELFCDGIHFSKLGGKVLFDHLILLVEKKIRASYGKPLRELVHTLPWHQRPEVLAQHRAHGIVYKPAN